MQVAAKLGAFIGDRVQGAPAHRLQFAVPTQGVDETGGLVGELVEQRPVRPAVGLAGGAVADPHLTQPLPAVHQRQHERGFRLGTSDRHGLESGSTLQYQGHRR
jgi:hypothetical protein